MKVIKLIAGYLLSFAIILACLAAGNLLQSLLSVSIPGSIFGMLILFALLATGLVKIDWIRPTSTLFIRYMILLFVPISVGLMNHYEMLLENALPILASAIGGTAIVLVCLSLAIERLLGENKK
ncbi:CidA/LrgA family protein [Vibrio sp. SCSIO 43136]|uniref:CidA/LrgA family protein n=1 Tax=Vibrio sp. SCSIO 43136 TaxID=2819101 RepID=UPI0020756DB5|nr:CidA/LrgA family protein [Vibrio sp. SCSIO 43136]USD63993.1 CidA/LrgA family protein [Vibrio sp. SCSIO 43136]